MDCVPLLFFCTPLQKLIFLVHTRNFPMTKIYRVLCMPSYMISVTNHSDHGCRPPLPLVNTRPIWLDKNIKADYSYEVIEGGRVAAALCHGVVRVLLGWQRWGERATALQHHRQWEGRALAVVGVRRHFGGHNVRMMAG